MFKNLVLKSAVLLGVSSSLLVLFQNCSGEGMQTLSPERVADSGSFETPSPSATGAVTNNERVDEFEMGVNQTLEKVIDSAGIVNPKFEIQSYPKLGVIKSFQKQSGLFVYQPNSDFVGIDEMTVSLTGQDGRSRNIRLKIYVNETDRVSFSIERISDSGQALADGIVYSGNCTKIRLTRKGSLRELAKTAQVEFDEAATRGKIYAELNLCNPGGVESTQSFRTLEFSENKNVREFYFRSNETGTHNATFQYGSLKLVQSFTVKMLRSSVVRLSLEGPSNVEQDGCSPFVVYFVDQYQNKVSSLDLIDENFGFRIIKAGSQLLFSDPLCSVEIGSDQSFSYPSAGKPFYLKSRGLGFIVMRAIRGTLMPDNVVYSDKMIQTTGTIPLTPKIERCLFFSELTLRLSARTSSIRYYVVKGTQSTASDCGYTNQKLSVPSDGIVTIRDLSWNMKNDERMFTVVVCPVEYDATVGPKLLIDLRFPLILSGGYDSGSFQCTSISSGL